MKICDSDAFLDMPLSTQALYFHLNMRADDDGFVGNPKRIQRTIGACEDDLKLLIAKRFVLVFADGVIVIKHWKMHNCIQSDRYHPTVYQEELKMLYEKQNKSYTLDSSKAKPKKLAKEPKSDSETKCIQNGNQNGNEMETNSGDLYTDMETKCIQNVSSGLGLALDLDLDKDISIKLTDLERKKVELVKDLFAGWQVSENKIYYLFVLTYKHLPDGLNFSLGDDLAVYHAIDDLTAKARAENVKYIYAWMQKLIPELVPYMDF